MASEYIRLHNGVLVRRQRKSPSKRRRRINGEGRFTPNQQRQRLIRLREAWNAIHRGPQEPRILP